MKNTFRDVFFWFFLVDIFFTPFWKEGKSDENKLQHHRILESNWATLVPPSPQKKTYPLTGKNSSKSMNTNISCVTVSLLLGIKWCQWRNEWMKGWSPRHYLSPTCLPLTRKLLFLSDSERHLTCTRDAYSWSARHGVAYPKTKIQAISVSFVSRNEWWNNVTKAKQ